MKMKLDEKSVGSLGFEPHKQVLYFDTKTAGFFVCVGKTTKTFYIQRDLKGKAVRVKIGKFPEFKVARAREEAEKYAVLIQMGRNPNIEKKKLKATLNDTLTSLWKSYQKSLAARGKLPSVTNYKNILDRYFSDWLPKSLDQITRQMVMDRHALIAKKSGEKAANLAFRVLRALFNHHITDHPDFVNPVLVLRHKKMWFKEAHRTERISKDHEFKAWYKAVKGQENVIISSFLLFVLFNGVRRNEALNLRWEDVDFRSKSFIIRETKNGKPLELPLSKYSYGLLKSLQKIAVNEWVFPSFTSKSGHLMEPKKVIQDINQKTKMNIRTHDLRRTFASIANSLLIPSYTLKRLVNHSTGSDVTAIYAIPSLDELREPMEMIAQALMKKCGILSSKKA